ncbi:hypothetical protein [Tenacibaculum amylolyticum]|uniref:hypothetical protein n=1 Tax=Tenacibaculum amylolyticum TaxID=104269 RepID=UPI0038959BA6
MRNFFSIMFFAVFLNFSYAQDNITAQIDRALIKAKKENKHVFVNYLSTGDTSKKMKEQIKDEALKPILNSSYIVVTIEVSEEETNQYVNCSNPFKSFDNDNCNKIEFPFWYIIDDSGNFVGTSFKDEDKNIGYPSTKEDVDSFIDTLRNTSALTEVNLNTIANSFLHIE